MFVERVDLRCLGGSARRNDVPGDCIDGRPPAAGEKQDGPLAGKGARDGAADCPSASVDHRDLVLEHHRKCRHHGVGKMGPVRGSAGVDMERARRR